MQLICSVWVFDRSLPSTHPIVSRVGRLKRKEGGGLNGDFGCRGRLSVWWEDQPSTIAGIGDRGARKKIWVVLLKILGAGKFLSHDFFCGVRLAAITAVSTSAEASHNGAV